MKQNYTYSELHAFPPEGPDALFRRMEIPFPQTKEAIWSRLEEKLNTRPIARTVIFPLKRVVMIAAAITGLLIGTLLVMRYYTVTLDAMAGEQTAQVLPDGSNVRLNAGSELSWHPLWWRFSRSLFLEGEGFFEVQPGRKFEVSSSLGSTQVLGTSFNIYARDDGYQVTCLTGKVKVTSLTLQEAVLVPDYQASIDEKGNIIVLKEPKPGEAGSWTSGRFSFTARPLGQVLDEIERQYDVTINFTDSAGFTYTGYFSKDKDVEEVLELVCKPFGLIFARRSERIFDVLN